MRCFCFCLLILKLLAVSRAEAQPHPADTLRVRALDERGWALNQTQPDSALCYGQQALALARRTGFHRGELYCLNDLGTAHFYTGNYAAAMRYHLAVLRRVRLPADRRAQGFAYNGLANIYTRQANLAEARRHYYLALGTARQASDSALYRSNLGYFLADQGRSAEAERETRAALRLYRRLGQVPDQARCLFNLAGIGYEQQRWPQTRALLTQALALARPLRNPALLGQYLTLQADIENSTKYPAAALAALREALPNARQAADLETIRECYRNLAVANEQLGHYQQALRWQQQFQAANDSLLNQEQRRTLANLGARYRNEQQQSHIRELQERNQAIAQQAATQRLLLGVGTAGLLLALALTVLLYSRVRLKQRTVELLNQKNAEIARRDQDKEVLLREMHHRVKNNLQVVSSLLSLQARQLSDPGASAAIRDSRSRVEAMALLHQKLYQHEELRHVALRDYVRLLVDTILHTYGFDSQKAAEVHVADQLVDVDVALPLGLLLNELLTNACKYALPDHPTPRLNVELSALPTGALLLRVADNGPGLPGAASGQPAAQSFGRRLMGLLAQQLDTELHWSAAPGGGTVAEARLPLGEPAARPA